MTIPRSSPRPASAGTGTTALLSHWEGELALGECWASWSGRVGDSELHSHHAAQAVFDAGVQCQTSAGRLQDLPEGAVFIDPGVPHRVRPAPQGLLVFIEPGSGRQALLPAPLRQRIAAGLAQSAGPLIEGADRLQDSPWTGWLTALQCAGPDVHEDWIQAVRGLVDGRLPLGVVRLRDLAGPMGLSGERFRHVFAQRMGLPVRRYVLWRRLRLAVQCLQRGAGVTEAAMDAGFADAAHFGRTLHRQFGLNARRLFR